MRLFLPGWGSTAEVWAPFAQPDDRLGGKIEADDEVVAWSLGAMQALEAATRLELGPLTLIGASGQFVRQGAYRHGWPERTLARLADSLSAQGELQLATFGPRTFWELDQVLGELGCERGLNLPPAQKWETLLAGAGISRIRAHSCEERFSYPDCAAFLRSVKSSGAGYTPHVLAPGTLAEGMRRYDTLFSNGAGVTVTYEIVTLSGER